MAPPEMNTPYGGRAPYASEMPYGGRMPAGKTTQYGNNVPYGGERSLGGKGSLGTQGYVGGKGPLGAGRRPENLTFSGSDELQPVHLPAGANQTLVANTPAVSNSRTVRGKRPWTEAEHKAITQELKTLRAREEREGRTGKLGLRDEKLWAYISKVLKEKYNIDRSLAGAKYYWGRFGRAKSGFDERVVKDAKNMSTSVQHKKRA
jgi:hypothetical protein